METSFADLIGYAASIFIVLSFVMKDLRIIRIVNLIGCIFFVLYGVLKGDGVIKAMYWPVIIPNLLLCGVQIYYLAKKK